MALARGRWTCRTKGIPTTTLENPFNISKTKNPFFEPDKEIPYSKNKTTSYSQNNNNNRNKKSHKKYKNKKNNEISKTKIMKKYKFSPDTNL